MYINLNIKRDLVRSYEFFQHCVIKYLYNAYVCGK